MTAAPGTRIGVGDPAPEFELPDQTGSLRAFAELRTREGAPVPTVVYFYPGNFTPICTKEACAFRDSYEDFLQSGAAVIGISSDSPDSHRRFAAMMRLPFTLLSDADGRVRTLFGVPKSFGLFAGRVTYVIDAAGIVRMVFNAPMRASAHVTNALELIRTLNRAQPFHQS